jgi:hypothetical protein
VSEQTQLSEDDYAEPELPPDPSPVVPEPLEPERTIEDTVVIVDRETGELVPAPPAVEAYRAYDPVGASLDELGKIGRVFAQSGYFKDARDAAQCITKILAGRELGIGPFQSVAQFHIVEGKPTMSAGLVAAMVKRSKKYDFMPQTSNDQECILDWYQDGDLVGQSSFSMADAQRAKLIKNAWLTYPKAMLFNRALTAGARMYAPDCFGGSIYGDGELDA